MSLEIIRLPNSIIARSGLNSSGPVQGTSGVFVSGVDSSGVVQAPSILAQSGINASAAVKGTIGDFVATVLAGSGVNSSGKVGGTIGEFLASVLAKSGVNSSAPVQGTSVLAQSGLNASGPVQATAASVGNVNASQVNAGSGLFQSGIDVSAVIKAPSLVVTSVEVISGPIVANSITALSNLQVSNGPTQLGSTLEVSGKATIGGSMYVRQQLSIVGSVIGNDTAFFKGAVETSGGLSVAGSGAFSSGLNTSGVVNAAGLANFQSGANTSGSYQTQTPSTITPIVILLATGHNLNAILVSGVGGSCSALFFIDASGELIVASTIAGQGKISANTLGIFVSGINASATIAGVSGTFASSLYMANGRVDVNLASGQGFTIGFTTGTNAAIPFAFSIANAGNVIVVTPSGVLSMNASATFQSGLNTSAVIQAGGTVLAPTMIASTAAAGTVSVNNSVLVNSGIVSSGLVTVVATVLVQSGLAVSGAISIGGSVAVASTASILGDLVVSGVATVKSNLSVSGTLTVSGAATLASTLEASGLLSVGGAVHGGVASFANIAVSQVNGASGLFQSGLNTSSTAALYRASINTSLNAGDRIYTAGRLSADTGIFTDASGQLKSGIYTNGQIQIDGTSGLSSIPLYVLLPTGTNQTGGLAAFIVGNQRVDINISGTLSTNSSAIFQSGVLASGTVMINPPSGNPPITMLLPTGFATNVLLISGVAGGTSALAYITNSGVFYLASTFWTWGTISTDAGNINAAGSMMTRSGLNASATIAGVSGTFASSLYMANGRVDVNLASGQGFTIGFTTGTNAAIPFAFSIANAGNVIVVTPSGVLSMNASATFQSGLNTSGYIAVGGSITVQSIATLNGGFISVAGSITCSALVAGGSGLFQSGLTTQSYASVAGSGSFGSGLNASGEILGTSGFFQSDVYIGNYLSVNGSAIFSSGLNTSRVSSNYLIASIYFSANSNINLDGNVTVTNGKIAIIPASLNPAIQIMAPTGFNANALSYMVGNTDMIYLNASNLNLVNGMAFTNGGVTTTNGTLSAGTTVKCNTSVFVGSAIYPMSGVTVSTGAPNIGGANASQKFGTVFAASTNIGDLAFTDERCDICGSTFDIGEQVTVLLKGGVSGMDGDGNKWRYVGGPPIHADHLITSIVKSALNNLVSGSKSTG